jgi:hypothetical protein
MNTKYFSALIFTTGIVVLTGCNDTSKLTATCSATDSQQLVGKIITEGAEKSISDARYSDTGEFIFDKAKIRASLEQVKFEIESIRTLKEDPNSTKKFCSGVVKMTIPTNLLSDADKAREMNRKPKISQYARELNIDDSINVFTKKDVEYSVQPTDDGKELYVELESVVWVNLLDNIVSSALFKPILEVKKANEIQQNEQIKDQAKQEIEQLQEQTKQAKVETEKLKAIDEKQNAEQLKQDLVDAQKSKLTQRNQELPTTIKIVSPAFDCKKAKSPTEITICANPELSALDVENMTAYKKAKLEDPIETKETLSLSIKQKNSCKMNVKCIKDSYIDSITKFECISGETAACEGDQEQ